MTSQLQTVGMVWYRRGDYPRVLAVMDDAADLPDTFDQWLAAAENTERQLIGSGVFVLRALLRPDTFKSWCEREGRACDARSRSHWASEFAQRAAGPGR